MSDERLGAAGGLTAIRDAFDRYEAALVAGDLETLDASFSMRTDVVRFGVADAQFSGADVAAWRARQPPLPSGRQLFDTQIVLVGPEAAVATTCFRYADLDLVGRQTQIWVVEDSAWRIVSAHVSHVPSHG